MAEDETCITCRGVDLLSISDEEFANFCDLQGEAGKVPAGKISYITGKTVFIDANGRALTSEEYLAMHGFDPAPVWDRIKEYQKASGKFKDPVQLGMRRIKIPSARLGRY